MNKNLPEPDPLAGSKPSCWPKLSIISKLPELSTFMVLLACPSTGKADFMRSSQFKSSFYTSFIIVIK